MSKILSILSIFLIFNLGYSKALLVDSQHAIFSSLNIFVDTENVIDEQTDDYDRKVSSLSELNFSYVYNRTFEINLSYKNNPSIENGFMIPFEGAFSSFCANTSFRLTHLSCWVALISNTRNFLLPSS